MEVKLYFTEATVEMMIRTCILHLIAFYMRMIKKVLELACFENENLLNEVGIEELKEFYMYEVHYSCSFFL